MLFVEDNVIYLTKGDGGTLPIALKNEDNSEYELGPNDVLTLTVRMLPDKSMPALLVAKSTPGSNGLVFRSADSVNMEPGLYSADIELSDGVNDPFTVWQKVDSNPKKATKIANWENFALLPEVT